MVLRPKPAPKSSRYLLYPASKSEVSLWRLASTVAEDSTCGNRHGAVIAARGRVLSIAANRMTPYPLAKRYKKLTLHAEQRALLRAGIGARGATLVSARDHYNKSSMPCEMCMALCIDSGIRTVVFADGNGDIVKMRL